MTGCRHGAKNTLVKNYLYLAERAGAQVLPLTTVTAVRPVAAGGYVVETGRTGARGCGGGRRSFEADQVVFAAGALGTQRLLHRMRASGELPELSDRLGALTRTNSESILGAAVPNGAGPHGAGSTSPRAWRSRARSTRTSAPTSSRCATARAPTRWACCRRCSPTAGRGAGCAGSATIGPPPGDAPLRAMSVRRWSQRTVIALVMQSVDNSLTVHYRRSWYGRRRLVATPGHGAPNPSWIPAGNAAVRLLAEEMGGRAGRLDQRGVRHAR